MIANGKLDYADELSTKNERIVNCDLTKSLYNAVDHVVENTLDSSVHGSSTVSSESLFSLNSRKKLKNQFITINYSSTNMNKLISLLLFLNETSSNENNDSPSSKNMILNDVSSNLNNFIDFFHLKQFSKDSLDYAVYYDCLSQYKNNLKQADFLFTKPLCYSTWPRRTEKKMEGATTVTN